jgi:HSP20 family protein
VLEAFARRFEDLFHWSGDASSFTGWKPTVDIHELPEQFEVVAELPGMKKEDIEVSLDNGILEIAGERKAETERKEAKVYRVERRYGRFERIFTLPETADDKHVVASFADGVLKLKIGERALPESKATHIEIK